MITSSNHVIAPAGFALRGALALKDFRGILLPSIGGDQKKISPAELRAPSWYYGILW